MTGLIGFMTRSRVEDRVSGGRVNGRLRRLSVLLRERGEDRATSCRTTSPFQIYILLRHSY